jgi:hypothetical protein
LLAFPGELEKYRLKRYKKLSKKVKSEYNSLRLLKDLKKDERPENAQKDNPPRYGCFLCLG